MGKRAGGNDGGYSHIQVRRQHDDERVAASEFQDGLLNVLASFNRNLISSRTASGQRRRFDAFIVYNGSYLFAADQKRLESAFGEAGPVGW